MLVSRSSLTVQDYGEGKDVDLEQRPRTRLDEERVRYVHLQRQ